MSALNNRMDALMITQAQLRRLYNMSITGLYDSSLLNYILAGMHGILFIIGYESADALATRIKCQKLCKLLKDAETDSEKMIAIDTVIHTAHSSGVFAQHLIIGKDKEEITNFLDELSKLEDE
jgi:hypothetical protein